MARSSHFLIGAPAMNLNLPVRRTANPRDVRAALCNTSGAIDLASIMVGVLVIGIIGGIISATVFSVIPWSQDEAAKSSLDSVATAQSVARTGAITDQPRGYMSTDELTAEGLLPESDKFVTATNAARDCYVTVARDRKSVV